MRKTRPFEDSTPSITLCGMTPFAPTTRLSTAELAEDWTKRVISFTPIEKLCQLMMALALFVTVSVLPELAKPALPELTEPPVGLARLWVEERLKQAATDSASSLGLKPFLSWNVALDMVIPPDDFIPAANGKSILDPGVRRRCDFSHGWAASKAVSDGSMRPVVPVHAGARVFGDPCHIEPEREGLALVRAKPEAIASQLVFRAAFRSIVATARRVGEDQRTRAPVSADPRSEIGAITFEREPLSFVARRLALVVAAHAVRPAHAELLARDQQIVGLLGARDRTQDEIRRQQLRERDALAHDAVLGRSTGARGLEIRVTALVPSGNVARVGDIEREIAPDLRETAAVGQRDGPDRDIGNELLRGAHEGDGVFVSPVIQSERNAMFVGIDPSEQLRVAQSEHVAFARDVEKILHRARIDTRIPGKDIYDAAPSVDGNAVSGAEDLHVRRVAGGSDDLRAEHVVAIEEVGVLIADARAQVSGLRRARVVRERGDPRGILVGHTHARVDLAGVVRGLQRHAYLLGRVLVDELGVLADRLRIRRGALLERRQAGPDVLLVEKAVALDPHPADPRLDHAQAHLARADVLLGNAHAHRVVAAAGVDEKNVRAGLPSLKE